MGEQANIQMASDRVIHVLIVENDPDDRERVSNMLAASTRSNYILTVADTQEAAAKELASARHDICLLDYQLDGFTGLDVLESPAGAAFDGPIVVLTGNNDYEIDLAVMQAGAADFLPKAELSAALLERVIRYSMQHHASQKKFTYLARHDQVTGLFNRQVLHERLASMIDRAQRAGDAFAVLYFDLDGFKSINDSLGHGVGDEALYISARRLKTLCGDRSVMARIGGDEFVALVDMQRREELQELVATILDAFRKPIYVSDHSIFVTTSIGIALYPDDGSDGEMLLNNADAAMYAAKRGGRDTVHWFDSNADGGISHAGLDNELRAAIDRNELHLVYQPQFELDSGRVVGLEALARWNHPRLGPIAPSEFVPLAEARGSIRALTRWALHSACNQYLAWQQSGVLDADTVMAVNVSSQHAHDEDFLPLVERLLANVGMPANRLELEFTENALMLGEEGNPLIDELKNLGVQVVIDDFGKGYSSLSYLTRLPVDSLKIDLSFLRGVVDNPRDRAMARAIIALGSSLGLRVVAEGVENDAQRSFLVDNNCIFGQGFLYSPGLAVADCTRLLEERSPRPAGVVLQ